MLENRYFGTNSALSDNLTNVTLRLMMPSSKINRAMMRIWWWPGLIHVCHLLLFLDSLPESYPFLAENLVIEFLDHVKYSWFVWIFDTQPLSGELLSAKKAILGIGWGGHSAPEGTHRMSCLGWARNSDPSGFGQKGAYLWRWVARFIFRGDLHQVACFGPIVGPLLHWQTAVGCNLLLAPRPLKWPLVEQL